MAVTAVATVSPSPALAAPSLVLDKRVSTTTPAPGAEFTYTIRFRCASTFEHCQSATLSDTLPTGPELVSYSQTGGLIAAAAKAGNTITWTMKNPLTAGSTGLVTVVMKYPVCATAGFDPAPIANSATFASSNAGSVTANAPSVDGQAVPTCPVSPPTPPATDVAKSPASALASSGGKTYWFINFPSKPDAYEVIDELPAGAIFSSMNGGNYAAADCGAGWDDFLTNYTNPANVPTCSTTGSTTYGTIQYPTLTKLRFQIPANTALGVYITVYIDPNVAPGTKIQNCVTPSYAGAVETCGTLNMVSGTDAFVEAYKHIAGSPGTPYTNPYADRGPNPPAGMPQGPSDYVFQVSASKPETSGDAYVDPVIADLLPAGMEFVPEADGGTNWWSSYVKVPTSIDPATNPANNPACVTPTFEVIDNFASTGRTMLRWSWPGCTLESEGATLRVGVYFSARVKPTVTSGTVLSNRFEALSGTGRVMRSPLCPGFTVQSSNSVGNPAVPDVMDFDGDGDTAEQTCSSNIVNMTIPVIATVDSSKYVLGELDTDYSRFPATGDTDLAGNGEYNLYLTNQGNTPLTTFDLIDILPHVGDTSVTSPATPRGSEWGEELVSLDTVEHSLYATPDVYTPVPAGELLTGFSTSKNPCRWDSADSSETNRLKAAGGAFPTIASVDGPAGCDAPNWSATQAGARSFALRYAPSVPLAPGDTIKIHVTVKLAPGEAPAAPVNGKIAWNSFGFSAQTTAAAPNDFLLSTEPIQVGLKMVDTAATAAIGDYVWLDANHDGIQNEPTGIAGVQVGLYRPGFGPDGIAGNADDNTRVDVTTTDASGEYNFWGLLPDTSTYQVRLDRPSDFSTGPLKGFELTTSNTPDDALDSDAALVGAVPTITSTPALAAGSHTPTYDFGFFYPASLGDFVWEELGERNGVQDSGEPPVVGATVELFDAVTNASLGTTTTNSSGRYLFDNLNPGSYYVVFDLSTATSTGVAGAHNDPALYEYTTPNATGDETNDSDADSNGRTAVTTLVAGQHDPRWDAGISPIPPPPANPASLGDYTWIDLDKDGLQGDTEPVLAGVTVTLLDDLGFPIRTTTTNGVGFYEFTNLYPDREYSLKFTPPPGYAYTSMDASDDAKDSDADPASGNTAVVPPIGDNQHDPDWDAGFVPTYSLGNLVWIDTNNDGLVSPGEVGIEGVVVNLLDGAGDPVLDGAGDPVTMLTNSTGNYLFTGLVEGNYIVEIVPPTGGYISSTGTANAFEPAPDPDTVATDHDDNGTTVGATIRSAAVTLSYDAEPAGEGLTPGLADATPDTNGNYTVDFGIFIPPPVYDLTLAKTTSTLEVDGNGDDISWTIRVQNQGTLNSGPFTVSDTMPTGTSLNAASVTYTVGGTAGSTVGTPTPSVVGQVATIAFTDTTGLVAGGYVDITFTTNVDDITDAPFRNWAEISADSGDDDDSTPDTNTGSDQTVPNDGYISVTDLATLATDGAPGVEPTGVSADADDNDDAVVGRATILAVGDYVWFDLDRNGVQDAAESPVVGATAHLLMEDPATPGSYIDATHPDGSPVDDSVTNGDGFYLFDDLAAGNYRIEFTHDQAGYRWTVADAAAGTDATDSDATFTAATDLTAVTAPFLLAVGEANVAPVTPADELALNDGIALIAAEIDRTRDAGIWMPVAVGDYVWYDENHDGLQGATEDGAEDVTVTLQNPDGSTAKDAAGVDVPVTTTDVDGWYSFDNLLPGDYKIVFSTLPTGWAPTTQDAGVATDDDIDSDADVATLTTDVFSLVAEVAGNMEANTDVALDAGFIDPTIDLGLFQSVSLGDVVWYDANRDGIYDPATEVGVEGVTVTLTMDDPSTPAVDFGPVDDADGDPVGPDSTDADGRYSFTNLISGTYRVTFTLLNGYEWTVVNPAADDTLDSNALYTTTTDPTATTGNVILSGLTPVIDSDPDGLILTDPSVDAGIWFPFALGDLVWFDLDHSGSQDGTEVAVAGATAHLTMDDGTGNFVTAKDADGIDVVDDTTDAAGRYLFDNLLPGTYRVTFTHNQTGYRWTVPNAVTAGDVSDSDATFTAATDLTATTGNIVIAVGEANVRPTTGSDDTIYGTTLRASFVDPTNDAGIWMPLAVGDFVWYDLDRNGRQGSGEPGVNGVTVELLMEDPASPGSFIPALDADGVAVASTLTAAHSGDDGWYSFGNLTPGNYRVSFSDWPAGWAPTTQLGDTATDHIDSNPGNTGMTPMFNLSVNPALGNMEANTDASVVGYLIDPTIDMGIFQSVTLGDVVWYDADRDGIKDLTEIGVEGVRAHLTMEDPDAPGVFIDAIDADGANIGDEFTDPDGRYSFSNLISTSYKVTFTLPSGYEWTLVNTPDDTLDSDVLWTTTTDATATTGVSAVSALTPVTDNDPDGLSLTNPSVDAGIWFPLALGDIVWFDLDRDGVQDATELPVVGATAHLLMEDPATPGSFIDAKNADGAAVTDDTTDAAGRYLFDNLLPGLYRVVFDHNQAGYRWTAPNAAAGTDATDSDATFLDEEAATAVTGNIDLRFDALNTRATTAGDDTTYAAVLRATYVDPTNDAGIWMPLAVGDYVWYDIDHDGVQGELEDGVEGVTVTLLMEDPATPGSFIPAVDADDAAVVATQTDADGGYVFDRLLPGNYRVVFSTLPAGFIATLPNEGAEDAVDSDGDPVTLTSPEFTLSVDVADGNMQPNGNVDIDAHLIDPTIDLGIWAPLAIGDVVWYDANRDGIQEEGESPLEGITVTLLNGEGDPAVDANDEPVPPTTTDENGHYVFDNLLVGEYQVQFTLPTGAVITYQVIGDDRSGDSNPDDTGLTPVFVLDINEPNVREVIASDGVEAATTIDPTIDAGIWFPLAVGDYVWFDLDRDGIQETGELPVVGVTVALLMEDPEVVGSFIAALDADGEPVAPVTTDDAGHYVFDNLLEGTYQVQFSNLPATYQVTRQAMGADRLLDSNPDSTGLTPAFELTFDSDLVRAAVEGDSLDVAAFIDPTIDMGLWIPVAVGDYVWNDINHNGVQDTDEAPVAGVSVTLLNADGTPAIDAAGTPVPAATTDTAGHYVFDNLLPGSYVIQFSNLPAGFETTRMGAGTAASDSNIDPAGRTGVFTLTAAGGDMRAPVAADGLTTAAMINPTIDAGIWKPLAIGDVVWVDANRNGIKDVNEMPVKDVKVELLNPDGTPALDGLGSAVPSVKTDAAGHYVFDNLLPGDYKVRFSELPKGSQFTIQNGTGSTVASDSNADRTTGVTSVFNLNPTDANVRAPQAGDGTIHYINPTIDAGLVRLDGAQGALPVTGGNAMTALQVGLLLLGAGAILTVTTRRRKQRVA